MMHSVGEREEKEMTAREEIQLIEYLERKGWSAKQILYLLKYIKR